MNSPEQRAGDPRLVLILFVATGCLVVGCRRPDTPERTPPTPTQKPFTEPPPLNALPPGYSTDVSEEEAVAFALNLENAVAEDDLTTINELIDWELIVERTVKGLPFPEDEVEAATRGLRGVITEPDATNREWFLQQILHQLGEDGSYRFLRVTTEDSRRHVLFRSVVGGTVDYHRYPLVRTPSGDIVASEFYAYTAAGYFSEGCRPLIVGILTEHSRPSSNGFSKSEEQPFAWIKTAAAIREARKDGRFEDALRLHEQLPDSMRRTRCYMMAKVTAAMQVSEKACLAAMEEYLNCFANDGPSGLLAIRYHSLREEYEEALVAVEVLDGEVQDPYLDLIRADLLYARRDLAAARESIERFVGGFPEFIDGHDVRATIALAEGDFSAVTQSLMTLHRDFGVDPVTLTNLPLYAPYRKNKEYDKLSEHLKKHTETPKLPTNPKP